MLLQGQSDSQKTLCCLKMSLIFKRLNELDRFYNTQYQTLQLSMQSQQKLGPN